MTKQATLIDDRKPWHGDDQLPAKIEPAPLAVLPEPSAPSVENILMLAVERGVSAEAMERLVALHERLLANKAEMAFNAAFQKFQSECPRVVHNKTGHLRNSYASLDHIEATIRPYLAANGLSYSFDAEESEWKLSTTCIVHHEQGHSRRATFQCHIDKSAKQMNPMQQAASAHSYGRRYALLSALGLTTADTDDDGGAAQEPARPERNESAPTAKPRGERVTQEDVAEVVTGWKQHIAEDPNDKAAYTQWVVVMTGINEIDVPKWRKWTPHDLEVCHQEINQRKAMP